MMLLWIIQKAIDKIAEHGVVMPGVFEILEFLKIKGFTIGLATSSPMSLVDVVVDKIGIRQYLHTIHVSRRTCLWQTSPWKYTSTVPASLTNILSQCICFEDSFNGMIAAKAARMKCVVVPAPVFRHKPKWNAADLQLKACLILGRKNCNF